MLKNEYYRQLASANNRIADARVRIEEQKRRVLELIGLPACGEAVRLLRTFDRSMRVMTHRRAMLIRQLIHWRHLR